AEEAMAGFVMFFLASRGEGTPESWAMARAVAADMRLPLAARALAHQHLVRDKQVQPAASLRASDLHYASAASAEEWWGAPGQEVMLDAPVHVLGLPAERPLRLRGGTSETPVLRLNSVAVHGEPKTRLTELRDLTVEGGFHTQASSTNHAPILLARNVLFRRNASLAVSGFARLEDAFLDYAGLTVAMGGALELQRVQGWVAEAKVAGEWRVRGGQLGFSLRPELAATARVAMREAQLSGALPFKAAPGATVLWRDVVAQCDGEWPATLPAAWSVQQARIAAPLAGATQAIVPLAAPHTGQVYVLAGRTTPPTKRVESLAALRQALYGARPGELIELAAGDHSLTSPIEVPPGVTLVGATGSKVMVSRAASAAFTFSGAGAVALRDIHNEVVNVPGSTPGTEIADMQPKTALTVGREAWVIIQGGDMRRWHHAAHTIARVAAGGRLEFKNHPASDAVLVQPGGLIVKDPQPAKHATAQRRAIAQRTRTEQWEDAARRYGGAIAKAGNRAERVAATRSFGDSVAATVRITEASRIDGARAYLRAVVPVMQRNPSES
ncbi:MAG TPA: hypothetical protein VGE76_09145, partial [Opitutaceae bacterium]